MPEALVAIAKVHCHAETIDTGSNSILTLEPALFVRVFIGRSHRAWTILALGMWGRHAPTPTSPTLGRSGLSRPPQQRLYDVYLISLSGRDFERVGFWREL